MALQHFSRDLPDYTQLADYAPPITTRLHAGDGRLITEYAVENRLFVPIEAIPDHVIQAFISAEDQNFYDHSGIDFVGILRAALTNVRNLGSDRRLVGASTITQQVAKNLWLTPRRSLTRKLREAMLTRQLEKHLSKERILDLHLNIAEFGPGIYGAEAAARHYFGIPASGLSPRQGAMLAAGLPRPRRWNPASESEYYRASVDRILDVESRLEFLDRYVGAAQPGLIGVRPPEVPAPTPQAHPTSP